MKSSPSKGKRRSATVKVAGRVARAAERLTRKDVARLTGVPARYLGQRTLGSLVGTLALDNIWEGKE